MFSKRCIAAIFSCCFIIAALVFFLLGIPMIIKYAIPKPNNPSFTLVHASVTGFNLSSDGHLTALFDVVIEVNSRSDHKLEYKEIRFTISKNKQQLSNFTLDHFNTRERDVTMLRSKNVLHNVKLKESELFDFRFESGRGYIDFDVYMRALLIDGINLEVNCKHAIVNVTSSIVASNISTSKDDDKFRSVGCSVEIYRSSNL